MCISYLSAQRAIKKLHLHLYHIHVVQQLKEPGKAKCLWYCWWFHVYIEENWTDTLDSFFSDEAWFHLSSYRNSQKEGCGVVNIHVSSKKCRCILKRLGYWALSLLNIWSGPFSSSWQQHVLGHHNLLNFITGRVWILLLASATWCHMPCPWKTSLVR
jgi:hypothetical protein